MNWVNFGINLLPSAAKHPGKYNIVALAFSKKGKLLSVGHNSYIKTHPLQSYFANKVGDPLRLFVHAELDALIKAKHDVYKMLVLRLRKDGSLALSKPCKICTLALRHYGVQYVEYTDNTGKILRYKNEQ